LTDAINGVIVGLVGITAGCATLQPWAAIIAGFVSAVVLKVGIILYSHPRVRVDDPVDAVGCHFFGGIAGLMCANILSDPDLVNMAYGTNSKIVGGLFYGHWQMFVCAILVLIATTAWVGGLTLALYIVFLVG